MRTLLVVLAALAAAPATLAQAPERIRPPVADPKLPKELYAVFETSRGKIGVKLLPGEAPVTVTNFVGLAEGKLPYQDPFTGDVRKDRYFDDTLIHRAEPGFVLQGGDPATKGAPIGAQQNRGRPFGMSGPGYAFADELPKPGARLFEKPCVLAMANAGANTNGSQFFITAAPTPNLDPRPCRNSPSGVCGYTRFGMGVCGCELVPQIAAAGYSQTKLVKVTIQTTPPTCK